MLFPVLLLLAFCLMAKNMEIEKLFHQIPAEISGWKQKPGFKVFGPDTLFDYIDGGAELYLSYGFKNLLSFGYFRTGQPDITVDIFDMGTSAHAFGVFSHSRETLDQSIGQGSEYSDGLLIFWKGKYYVSLLAYPETQEVKMTILKLGARISDWIKEKGKLPAILQQLPAEGLIRESIRYFFHYIWLNSHYFISNDNILHINENTEAVLAKYEKNHTKYLLLLVDYPDQEKAFDACTDFVKHYLSEAANGIRKISDDSWAGCRIAINKLWVVLNADNEKEVIDIFTNLSVE